MLPQPPRDDGAAANGSAQPLLATAATAANASRPGTSAGLVQPHSARAASASARRPHSSAASLSAASSVGSSGGDAPAPVPAVHVHSLLGQAPVASPPGAASRWQSFDSPSGRLREREKQLQLQRHDPNRTHWQTSANYKYVNAPAAAVKLAKQVTCDYASVNARLTAQQQRQAEQQRQQRLAAQAEREAARAQAEEDAATEALRIQTHLAAEQRRLRDAEEDAQRMRIFARREAAAAAAAAQRAQIQQQNLSPRHAPFPTGAAAAPAPGETGRAAASTRPARSHKRNPTPVVPLSSFVPAPRSGARAAAAAAADRIAESEGEEDEDAEEEEGSDAFSADYLPPSAALSRPVRAHKRNPTPVVPLSSLMPSAARARPRAQEPPAAERIEESGDEEEEDEEGEERFAAADAFAARAATASAVSRPHRSHKRNPTPMVPLSSFVPPPARSATKAARAAKNAAAAGRIAESEENEEEEVSAAAALASPSNRLGPSSSTLAAFSRPSRSHKRNPTPMVPLSSFLPPPPSAASRSPAQAKTRPARSGASSAAAAAAAAGRILESGDEENEEDAFVSPETPSFLSEATAGRPSRSGSRSHKRSPTPIIPLNSFAAPPARSRTNRAGQRGGAGRIAESEEGEEEDETEGADTVDDAVAAAPEAELEVVPVSALLFRSSGRTATSGRPARSHKRNPTPMLPPRSTWAPAPRSRDMYAPWERIGERNDAAAPAAAAGLGEQQREEEEDAEPESAQSSRRAAAQALERRQARRERMLRADLAEEGFEGDAIDLPSEGELEEILAEAGEAEQARRSDGNEQGDAADGEAEAEAGDSDDKDGAAAVATGGVDPDASSSDPDEEEAHMLELIDSTLSRALHESGRGVTSPGPKTHIGVEQLNSRRKHRRMDSQHPYAKVEQARKARASLSKREMAAINAAVAAGGIAAGAAATAAAASQQAAAQASAATPASTGDVDAAQTGLSLPGTTLSVVPEDAATAAATTAATAGAAAPLALAVAPPATLRMFPPALVAEVDDAHRALGHFIRQCQRDTRPCQGDPQALVSIYLRNFLQLLADSGLDSNGCPFPSSDPSISATVAGTAPPAHVILCASYLAVKVCESGALTSHGARLLLQLLNTTFFAVFDVAFEEGARAGTGPPCKRTPFSTRLKHLQAAHLDVQKYKRVSEKRLRYNLRSLRLVISQSDRRFCHLAFRAWAAEVQMSKKRNKIYQLSLKKKQHKSKEKEPQQDDQMVSVFFYWRAHARTAKLQRLLGDEVSKLSGLLHAVRMEASTTAAGNAGLGESIQVLAMRLHKLEEEKLTPPIRPDRLFAPAFMEGLFGRLRAQLDALRDADPAGFVPLYKLAPRHARRLAAGGSAPGSAFPSPPAPSRSTTRGSFSATGAATAAASASTAAGSNASDVSDRTDELLKQLSSLASRGHWSARQELFALIASQRHREESEEGKNYLELEVMDPEDLVVLWTNFLLGHSPASAAAVAVPPTTMTTTTTTTTPAATASTSKSRASAAGGGAVTALAPSESLQKEKRRLRDFSTDLRDSTLYMQLLQVLGPELPTHKVDKLFDLHSKAKLILSLSAMIGCRLVMSEWEYVEGVPDLHLLFLGNVLLARHGLRPEPHFNSFQHKTNRLLLLRDHWQHLLRMDHVPPVTAYSFLGHLMQLSLEVDVLAARHARRAAFHARLHARMKAFLWSIQRARFNAAAAGQGTGAEQGEGGYYVVRHINSRFHTYEDEGTVAELVVNDPARIAARIAYAQSQTPLAIALAGPPALSNIVSSSSSGSGSGVDGANGVIGRQHRPRLVQDDDTEVPQQLAEIKRLFACHRVELKKIQKHYSTDAATNQTRNGVDYMAFVQFCRDCGFLGQTHPTKAAATNASAAGTAAGINMGHLWRIFHASIGQGGAATAAATAAPSTASAGAMVAGATPPLRASPGFDPVTGAPLPLSDEAEAPQPSTALLTPSQFLDTLIRLADLKYSATMANAPLSARLAACVEQDVLVGACRTVVDEFRQAVASEAVRAVFKANKGKLSALFRRYSTIDAPAATAATATTAKGAAAAGAVSSNTSPTAAAAAAAVSGSQSSFTMNFPNFLALLSDANMIDSGNGSATAATASSKRSSLSSPLPSVAAVPAPVVVGLTPSRLRVLFQNVQQDEEYGDGDDPAQAEQLSYVEFLEALAALACWAVPDPFMPLATKLDTFLTDTLFAPLKRAPVGPPLVATAPPPSNAAAAGTARGRA